MTADCCLKYVKELDKRTQRHAVTYKHQKPDGGCNIPAVIFIMRRGRLFCTNPNEKWVKELMQKIDKKGYKHLKHNPRHPMKN
ncbi:C-C motif chemokine 25-like [Cololabis saira]|uniref:C-C motif chemokine 25-like n=1 Tax=Cololabis saira TaxID=129043 RepID=UPI002AD383EC|nr:C-C motif chemokine 25-like [Cololabis saira]